MPGGLPTEVSIFLATIGLFFLIGIPVIRKLVRLPGHLEFEEVSESELNEPQKKHFSKIDQELASIGYYPLVTFRVSNLPNQNITRAYASATMSALGFASVIGDKISGAPSGTNYVELITEFANGVKLTVRNAEIADVLVPEANHRIRNIPGAHVSSLKKNA